MAFAATSKSPLGAAGSGIVRHMTCDDRIDVPQDSVREVSLADFLSALATRNNSDGAGGGGPRPGSAPGRAPGGRTLLMMNWARVMDAHSYSAAELKRLQDNAASSFRTCVWLCR